MKKSLFIIMCSWIFIVVAFVISQKLVYYTGTEVLLKTVPVDPRDLIRGDYVILNYEISERPHTDEFQNDETVYVVLKPDKNNIGHALNISKQKPRSGLFIKGRVGRTIKFGIESYFVKEGTGKILEKNLRNGTLVRVVIDKNGNAKVKGFVESRTPPLPPR